MLILMSLQFIKNIQLQQTQTLWIKLICLLKNFTLQRISGPGAIVRVKFQSPPASPDYKAAAAATLSPFISRICPTFAR